MWIFAAQSGACAAVGPAHELEPLDEVPPAVVVVGVGLRVEAALEVRHHEHPAGEDEQVRAARRRAAGARARRRSRRKPGDPSGATRGSRTSRPQRMATPSVRQRCIVRSSHGSSRPTPSKYAAWPNSCSIVSAQRALGALLLRTRTSPSRSTSMQNACCTLPGAGREVAARDDAAHVEAHRLERADGQRLEIGVARGTGRGRRRSRRARPGRTGRRSATGAARRRRPPKRAASCSSSSAFDRAERRGGDRRRPRRASRTGAPRRSRSSRARARSDRGSRATARPGCAAAASSRTSAATSAPTLFDASHAAASVLACRRSCAGSSEISLSSTDSPSIVPRCRAKRDSMSLCSSTISAPQVGVDLVRREALLEHLELARDERVEPAAPTGRRGSSAKASGSASASESAMSASARRRCGLVARVDVRVPPRRVGRGLQRLAASRRTPRRASAAVT